MNSENRFQKLETLALRIDGTHCKACETLIERKFKAIAGVRDVSVHSATGHAEVTYIGRLDLGSLQNAVKDDGYAVSLRGENIGAAAANNNTPRDYIEIGAAFLVVVGIALILDRLNFLPQHFAVSETMSYALVFVIGLVASISTCIAVTGGLLVAVAAKYNESSGYPAGVQRLKPHIYFNVGRIASYTLLGGAVGALGSAITFSPAVNGVLTIVASAVMILLGLQMLKLLPSLTRLIPTMPKFFANAVHDLAERDTRRSAFVLGAATFFFPCGFTQALQLYILAKASFVTGALTMLAFSLGTLPALLSLSVMSSFAKGGFQKHFLKLAGAAVVALGLMNIQYGLVLAGGDMSPTPAADSATQIRQAAGSQAPAGEKQIVAMRIVDYDYRPNRFTVTQGVPVEWWIDASEAAGCGRFLLAPKLGIRKILSSSSTTKIAFTPSEAGDFGFNCGMGMMTPGSGFTVVPNPRG